MPCLLHQLLTSLSFWPGDAVCFGWGRKCTCGQRFNRGHTTCMPFPSPNLTQDQQALYNIDCYVLNDQCKYTMVDFLLNQRLWDKARNILSCWTTSMSDALRAQPSWPSPLVNWKKRKNTNFSFLYHCSSYLPSFIVLFVPLVLLFTVTFHIKRSV